MKKNYPINMKVPVAHLQMGKNQSANFQKNSCAHLLEHHQNQVHRRGTNRHTDRQGETNTLFAGSIMIRIKVTDLVAVLPRKDTPL